MRFGFPQIDHDRGRGQQRGIVRLQIAHGQSSPALLLLLARKQKSQTEGQRFISDLGPLQRVDNGKNFSGDTLGFRIAGIGRELVDVSPQKQTREVQLHCRIVRCGRGAPHLVDSPIDIAARQAAHRA